ncbi:MAG: hypothetical protein M1837_006730 [Sclerophora amabilis]|nr:MAG: hypothetical protein M1837_006730 [Sclerophora amabilis]
MAGVRPAEPSLALREATLDPGQQPQSTPAHGLAREGAALPDLDQNFVFPARPPSSASTALSVNLSQLSGAPRHPADKLSISSRRASKRNSSSTLPAFSFNPAGYDSKAHAYHASESVPQPASLSANPINHRRRESEFVGGDGSKNGPGLMSTSPTKGEGSLPVPPASRGASRKGHRHRRSGAISCHDVPLAPQLSELNAVPRAGSAPTTPAAIEPEALSPPFDTPGCLSAPEQETSPAITAEGGVSRARVGFSDTLEFIPRPLSTLSDETSSSMTTVLGGHSSTGSIASNASGGTYNPTVAIDERLAADTIAGDLHGEETTALRAALSSLGHSSSGSIAANPTLSHKSSTSSNNSPTRTYFSFGVPRSPAHSGPSTPGECGTETSSGQPSSTASHFSPLAHNPPLSGVELSPSDVNTSPEEKVGSMRKNVKSWAGSILPRKTKSRVDEQKTQTKRVPDAARDPSEPAPTVSTRQHAETGSTVAEEESPSRVSPPLDLNIPTWSPRVSFAPSPVENTSPMIDLDAALGPFNTPDSGTGSESVTSSRPWRMYAGKTGRSDSPESNVHRRADSEPALPAFKRDLSSLHRLGSSSTMTEVIIEDDEDEYEKEKRLENAGASSPDVDHDGTISGIGIQVVDSDGPVRESGMDWTVEEKNQTNRDGQGLPQDQRLLCVDERRPVSAGTQHDSIPEEPSGCVEILDDEDPLGAESVAKSSDSTITPPLSPTKITEKPTSSPVELNLPASNFSSLTPETCSTLTSSTISSPDFPPSSFGMPPNIAAASSFTDGHGLDSLIAGEPGPELRTSVDDVPSLTSSNSTMTSGIHHYAGPYPSEVLSKDRPSSSPSAVARPRSRRPRSANRSSLVSLSRLMGGSHERSKLSIEERAEPESPERAAKDKKGKRLSRLKFWKSQG